jgi:hypothetical protein
MQDLQDGDECPEGCCSWMPYQKGQAAKTDELPRRLQENPSVTRDGEAEKQSAASAES